MSHRPTKVQIDAAEYARRSRHSRAKGDCFICRIAAGTDTYRHHIVYEDPDTIVFLNRYPTLIGYCLIAPRKHVESWVHELSLTQYLSLQRVAYQVGRAVAATLPTERMYSLSLGSQQANAHLHWHIAPLPPGVPYDEQEFNALRKENGVLDVSEAEQADLASAIRSRL
jgi:diadenosine tetraphosphate (Ap4A) HIT family hydrolase